MLAAAQLQRDRINKNRTTGVYVLKGANKNDNYKLLNSLASELKRPLILIARQAEFYKSQPETKHLQTIQKTAEDTLRLIDSYLLTAQSEYGQQVLPVKSFGVGSVIANVAEDIRPVAAASNIKLVTDINDALVIANPAGLKAAIWCLSSMAIAGVSSQGNGGEIEINTKKSANDLKISILSKSMNIKKSDLKKIHNNTGDSHMGMSSFSSETGIRLAIADMLGESLGTQLKAIKIKNKRGIGFNLALSSQLRLNIG